MKKFYFLLLGLFFFNGVNAQIVNIPDVAFKAKLLEADVTNSIAKDTLDNNIKIDANNDNQIQLSEALNVYKLDISYGNTIYNIIGIISFTNLRDLNCSWNYIANLDVTELTNLKSLNCRNNYMTSLNIIGMGNLIYLDCMFNSITNINLSGLSALETLLCRANGFTNLNVQGLSNLKILICRQNYLTSLNVSGLYELTELDCSNYLMTSLTMGQNENLESINISGTQLTSINLSSCKSLLDFTAESVPLLSLYLKNGSDETLQMYGNPNLQYVCVDESQQQAVQNIITNLGYTNCVVNSYCSFTPGGTYYTIQGVCQFDTDNNGCNVSDITIPNLNFSLSNGSVTGNHFSSQTGAFSFPVGTGTHSMTPILENPTYFTISPTTVDVTFPAQASPFTKNFCVTANGIHPDLEVVLLPLNTARPGFDANYKIIYKNKGNTTQSGSVNLIFNDAVLDMVTANPVVSNQSVNNLSWNFANLLPLQSREIILTLNVNSPVETPSVNIGDQLNFSAIINSVPTDETPADNTFGLKQIVVGSFDPNDKACLEGATISPEKVGDYVHYMIRFENNGTANAQNIVVKDMIDLVKFDINTLVPIKGSHSFITNITSDNKLEFIFANINLPFNDATNDGFVAFKIKTKPTLVLEDTFSNTASIYFDYNFPIVTNTSTTTIAVLAIQDFVFSNYFTLYPNPVKDILNITAKETIQVSSINIYNTLGQLVLLIPNAQNTKTVNVSSLTTGNYFIKINSNKGTSNTKFIKN